MSYNEHIETNGSNKITNQSLIWNLIPSLAKYI